MSLIKKISKIFSFLIILSFLASCEEGCFTADQFDSYTQTVNSRPSDENINKISITRDHTDWQDTALRSSGDEFIIRITGQWTAWDGINMTSSKVDELPACNICARKNDDTSLNCICQKDQVPESYPGRNCERVAQKGDYSSENDPTSCSCTTDPSEGYDADPEFNLAYAENIKYSTLNYFEKDGTIKIADKQSRCKYSQGAGLYIGLFGPTGKTIPNRVYHLYSPTEVCNLVRASDGSCVDDAGNDRTAYEFRSANSRIFMKDDNAGNLGTDTQSSDDVYHTSNEIVKFKIYDEEYSNNFGQYNLQILRGVGDSSDRSQVGLLEYMVRLVEDSVLGDINNNDERVGGIIEFMYKAIVQDSGFMGFLRICLVLYVSIYGMAILSGVAEISKKELMSRILKIGLVLLFTSSNSWGLYSDIVVGFFLDGMDSVISMITSMSLQSLDVDSSALILDAQLDRSSNVSSSTRFTYIDNTIIMLMSEAVSAKIFGLILASPFGILYVLVIYALIAIFIAVMAFAATVYLINVLKIVFALSLGPLFIVFVLFGQTSQMFKNWISFLAGRSMEIVIMFLVLFNFVVILNITFVEMLSYSTCVETLDLIVFKIPYLKSYINRSLMEWVVYFMKILGLSFMTYLVLEKVGEISGQLISVAGSGNEDSSGGGRGGSGFSLASKFISGAAGVAGTAAGKAMLASAYAGLGAGKAASFAARKSGISGAISGAMSAAGRATGLSQASKAISQRMPLSLKNPREFIRDQKYKGIISRAKKDVAKGSGTKDLTGKARDEAVRSRALAIFENSRMSDKLDNETSIGKGEMHTANMLGMTYKSFEKSMNRELVEKPLMNAIKAQAKLLQSADNPGGAKFGKDMKDSLHQYAKEWSEKNLAQGSSVIKPLLATKDNFNRSKFEFQLNQKIEDSTKLSAYKAAKSFYGNEEKQKEYLSHLQDRKNSQKAETARLDEDRNKRLAPIRWASKAAGAAARQAKSMSVENYRPDLAARNFARNLENQKAQKDGGMTGYIGNKLNLANRNDRTQRITSSIKGNLNQLGNVAKNTTSKSFGLAKKSMGYEAKQGITKSENAPKVDSYKTDRQTSLDKQSQEKRAVLREKLSSSRQDKVQKSNFDHINNQKDKNKSPEVLRNERKAFEDNRFNREAMQRQLSQDSVSSLKSQLGSSKDAKDLESLAKEDGFSKLISGEKDDIKADSAFEQAARLQYINDKFELGDKDYTKDLMEKFNEKVNSDIDDTKKAIEQDIENGDRESYNKHMQDLEAIEKSKSSAFSDFSNEKAGDDRYKEFFANEMQLSIEKIQGRLNNDYETSFIGGVKFNKPGPDLVSSEKEPEKLQIEEELHSMDPTDKKAKSGDLSVERMTHYNDREMTDKLESIKGLKGEYEKSLERKEEVTQISSNRKNAKESIDKTLSSSIESLKDMDEDIAKNTKKTILEIPQDEINKIASGEKSSNILEEIAKYDIIKEKMGINDDSLASKFNKLASEKSEILSKSISESLTKKDELDDDAKEKLKGNVESLQALRDLEAGIITPETLQNENVKEVLDVLEKTIEQDKTDSLEKEANASTIDEAAKEKEAQELDEKIQKSREEEQKVIDEYNKAFEDAEKQKKSDAEVEIINAESEKDNSGEDDKKNDNNKNDDDAKKKAESNKSKLSELLQQQNKLKGKKADLEKDLVDAKSKIDSLSKLDPKDNPKAASEIAQLKHEIEMIGTGIKHTEAQLSGVEHSKREHQETS